MSTRKNSSHPDTTRWQEDYALFACTVPVNPPQKTTERIFNTLTAELHPSVQGVFLKLSGIHLMIGTLSLLACPQFGLNLLPGSGLMTLLMRFGHFVCMMGCGAFFVGGSLFVASLWLRPEEVRLLRQHPITSLLGLGTLSLGAFICSGAEIFLTATLFWLIGALIGGTLLLHLGWRLKLYFLRNY